MAAKALLAVRRSRIQWPSATSAKPTRKIASVTAP